MNAIDGNQCCGTAGNDGRSAGGRKAAQEVSIERSGARENASFLRAKTAIFAFYLPAARDRSDPLRVSAALQTAVPEADGDGVSADTAAHKLVSGKQPVLR